MLGLTHVNKANIPSRTVFIHNANKMDPPDRMKFVVHSSSANLTGGENFVSSMKYSNTFGMNSP